HDRCVRYSSSLEFEQRLRAGLKTPEQRYLNASDEEQEERLLDFNEASTMLEKYVWQQSEYRRCQRNELVTMRAQKQGFLGQRVTDPEILKLFDAPRPPHHAFTPCQCL